jgi:hypothetical protein
MDTPGFGQGPLRSSCQHYNEPSRSIKDGQFLNQLSDYHQFNTADCNVQKRGAKRSWPIFMTMGNVKQSKQKLEVR